MGQLNAQGMVRRGRKSIDGSHVMQRTLSRMSRTQRRGSNYTSNRPGPESVSSAESRS